MLTPRKAFIERVLRTQPHLLISLLLIAATLVVFWQVTGHGLLAYDDDVYITDNLCVQDGLTRDAIQWAFVTRLNANWHPLTWISHMVDYELYELDPLGHHLTSLLLHMANVVFLFLVLRRMTKSLWKSGFVAALFAIHPLHVESVAWVSERKDVLSTLFWIFTMWAYIRYTERPILSRQLLVVAVFALGLMAKPMLVTLPFVLLLLDYWPLRRLKQAGAKARDLALSAFDLVWEKIPLFALAVASSIVTYQAQQTGGTVAAFDKLPFSVRAANALVAYVGYIGKMIWPRGLCALYPHREGGLPEWQVIGAGLLLVCVTVFVILMGRRRPYLAVGWLWYVGTLVPVIGLVQVGEQAMADRYTYVPLIGLFIMIAWGIPDVLGRGDAETRRRGDVAVPAEGFRDRVVLPAVAAAVIGAFMVCSWIQVGYWQDDLSLFRHATEVTKDNYIAHANVGTALASRGRTEQASEEFREAIRIQPDAPKPHYNLAVMLYQMGEYSEAWKELHLCEEYGLAPIPDFIELLSEQMPDPGD